ncbi:MAG: hypothetical protein FWC64_03640 [Treponema sp.]|nr:hypothetical protein [Treponema sp.]
MKKIHIIFAVFCVAALAACSGPFRGGEETAGGEGTITIGFPAAAVRAFGHPPSLVTRDEINTFEITLRGPGGTIGPITLSEGESRVAVTAAPGRWDIRIEGMGRKDIYEGYELRALGFSSAVVVAGRNTPAAVRMISAVEVDTPDAFHAAVTRVEDAGGGEKIIVITYNILVPGVYFSDGAGLNITLFSDTDVRIIRAGANAQAQGPLSVVTGAGTVLTLGRPEMRGHITLDGMDEAVYGPLIQVGYGAEVIMNHGVTLTGNSNVGERIPGGGVFVDDGGTFRIYGGRIAGNTTASELGNGIFVAPDGILTFGPGIFEDDFGVYREREEGEAYRGSGTANSPFLISSEAELRASLSAHAGTPGTHFRLTQSITLEQPWEDIQPLSLHGVFDGAGYAISELHGSHGMFHDIGASGRVENLRLLYVDIHHGESDRIGPNPNQIGAIAGTNRGTVQRVFVQGVVFAPSGSRVGGIVGSNYGIIQNSYVDAMITGNDTTGGIAGIQASSGTMENTFAYGNIYSTLNNPSNFTAGGTGGIVGRNSGAVSRNVALNELVSSGVDVNIGRVMGFASGEGLIGEDNHARSDLQRWYSTGGREATPPVSGSRHHGVSVEMGTDSGQANNQDFWVGLGWNFANVWEWDTETDLPRLRP